MVDKCTVAFELQYKALVGGRFSFLIRKLPVSKNFSVSDLRKLDMVLNQSKSSIILKKMHNFRFVS